MTNTTFDPNTPERIAAREREALVRPAVERVTYQYLRGLLTHDELVCELSELWVTDDATLRDRAARNAYTCPAWSNEAGECTRTKGHTEPCKYGHGN